MKRWAGVVAAMLICVGGYAAPDEDLLKVTMEGRAPGKDTAARDEAILNAEREIILQAIEGILPKPDLSNLKKVLDHLSRYIVPTPRLMKYDVEHDSVRVELEALVRNELLRHDIALCVLPRLVPPRRALILIAEQADDDTLSTAKVGTAETAATEALHEIGLESVDPDQVRSIYQGIDLLPRIQGDTKGMAELARENLADIIIAGTATKTHEAPPPGSNVQACRAVISISIVRASDGKMVESKAVEAAVKSENPREGCAQALEDACAKLKKDIGVPAVLAAAGTTPSDDVVISIAEPPAGDFVKEVLAALRARGGEQSAEVLLQTPHIARFRVSRAGAMDSLVDYVVSKSYAGLHVGPKRVVAEQMELEVTGK